MTTKNGKSVTSISPRYIISNCQWAFQQYSFNSEYVTSIPRPWCPSSLSREKPQTQSLAILPAAACEEILHSTPQRNVSLDIFPCDPSLLHLIWSITMTLRMLSWWIFLVLCVITLPSSLTQSFVQAHHLFYRPWRTIDHLPKIWYYDPAGTSLNVEVKRNENQNNNKDNEGSPSSTMMR